MVRKFFSILILLLLGFSANIFGQKTDTLVKKVDTLVKKLDSLKKEDTDHGKSVDISKDIYNQKTKITPSVYLALLGTDFTQEVTGPFHASGKTWMKVGIFAAIEGGLFFADKPIQREALELRTSNTTVRNVSSYVTGFGGLYEAYTLVALGAYGYIFKREKVRTTFYLATQAYAVSGAMQIILKSLTTRDRPNYYNPEQPSAVSSAFHGPFASAGRDATGKKLNGSFPSGHTTAAFAAATVFSVEYRDQPVIPIIAYAAATLVGLSRITENKHWATDVFAGAALGYVTGRQVAYNYHRYAKYRNEHPDAPARKKRHGTAMLKVDYYFGHVAPGLVYNF
ncbi:MAG: phosphatase PAP2 family protein [Bacteroidetes bacterium]|nr:phosphatase PAP2 family protein [Bacteroidota bacterium]